MWSLLQLFNSTVLAQRSHRQYTKGWTWLCANKTLFTKASVGPGLVHGPEFADTSVRRSFGRNCLENVYQTAGLDALDKWIVKSTSWIATSILKNDWNGIEISDNIKCSRSKYCFVKLSVLYTCVCVCGDCNYEMFFCGSYQKFWNPLARKTLTPRDLSGNLLLSHGPGWGTSLLWASSLSTLRWRLWQIRWKMTEMKQGSLHVCCLAGMQLIQLLGLL